MYRVQEYLKVLTGMDDFSLQAVAGSQSELTDVMITKAYYKEKDEGKTRTEMIHPDTTHGTILIPTSSSTTSSISRSNHHYVTNLRDINIC
jgi:glycine cleavage system protein P-like pyridoxal-binding family